MENKVKPNKSHLQFGVFFGLILVFLFVVVYVAQIDVIKDRAIGTSVSFLNYLFLPVLFVYLACSHFKKNNNSFISFVECLKVGVSVVFIGGLIFATFNVIFNLIFPDYIQEILSQTRQVMLQQNPELTSEQVEMALSMTKKFSSPFFATPILLAIFTFLGFIYSLIIGLIVRKENLNGF
jgi:hypothetical protein